jgi:hypothetical protein
VQGRNFFGNFKMISDRQNRFYWGLWNKAKCELMRGRETFAGDEENKRRHDLHVRAIGCDKSHYELTNREFDKVVAELRAIIDPSDLSGQLRQQNQHATRLNWGLRKVMRELGVDYQYVNAIVRRMNENGELGSNRIDALNVDDLRKVMIALREHKRRGGGTVKAPRQYILHPA